jgi:hypothetical protein
MKKLKFYTGGHPLVENDFIFQQNGIIEVLAALSRAWIKSIHGVTPNATEDVCILTGITPVSLTYNITAGYAFLDGEICQVDAWSRPELSNWNDWGLIKSSSSTFDSNGDKIYANNQLHQCYEIQKGEWVLITSIPQDVNYIPLEDVVTSRLFDVIIPPKEEPTLILLVNTTTPDNQIRLNKYNNRIVFDGHISDLVMSSAVNYTIPIGWRPQVRIIIICPLLGDSAKFATCIIETSGSVRFEGHGFTNPSDISSIVHLSGTYLAQV